MRRAATAALAVAIAGCGGSSLPADYRPVPVGRGIAFRLPPVSRAVAARRPVAGMSCTKAQGRSYAVHVELYARGLVVPVPAGVGIAPPQRRRGAYVLGGGCSYPLRTFEPTGVVVVDAHRPRTLGALFAIWGQPLGADMLAGFSGPVSSYLDGRRWDREPDAIPLRRHAEIVLEVGPHVPPHSVYRFPPGL